MKKKNEEKMTSDKRFRIRSKKLFLTYSKVLDIPNLEELFLKSLKDSIIGSGSDLGMNYLIQKENHEDGTPHIHVYLEFETTQYITSREQLQVELLDPNTGEKVIQVGKYEPVKNRDKVIQYIIKDMVFEKGKIPVENTNMALPIVNSVYYDSPESHLAAVLETEGYEKTCATLISCYKNLAVKKGSTILKNLKLMDELRQHLLSKSLMKIRPLDDYVNIPPEIIEWKKSPKTSLILHGPSNTGKTELAKSILKSMGRDVIFCRDKNSLRFESIRSDLSGIVYDDMNLSELSREEIIHFLDTDNHSQIRVLYGVVLMPVGVPRIFTTNDVNRIIGTFSFTRTPVEIRRRVSLVDIEKPLYQLNLNLNITNVIIKDEKIQNLWVQ